MFIDRGKNMYCLTKVNNNKSDISRLKNQLGTFPIHYTKLKLIAAIQHHNYAKIIGFLQKLISHQTLYSISDESPVS